MKSRVRRGERKRWASGNKRKEARGRMWMNTRMWGWVKEIDDQGLGLDVPKSATGYNSLFYESTWKRKQNCFPIRSDVEKCFWDNEYSKYYSKRHSEWQPRAIRVSRNAYRFPSVPDHKKSLQVSIWRWLWSEGSKRVWKWDAAACRSLLAAFFPYERKTCSTVDLFSDTFIEFYRFVRGVRDPISGPHTIQ